MRKCVTLIKPRHGKMCPMPDTNAPRAVRDVADAYVFSLAELNPLIATRLGLRRDEDRLPDLSPAGQQAKDELARFTLERLGSAERAARSGSVAGSGPGAGPGSGPAAGSAAGDERRCARLLRERLASALSLSEQGEHLRALSNIFGPVQQVRGVFMMMPTATEDDWAVVARRMARVAQALDGYRASLAEGARRGLLAAPRQGRTGVGQPEEWLGTADGRGWVSPVSDRARVPHPPPPPL